ncbi:MAG: 3-oxoacyl-ACP reductase FabG [Lachnospiraceae bacterium]|nr:3-oxoacyl-ACP reductase FabG [Lachnospiraceae bacterium]
MYDFSARNVVVTGAAQGIGRAIAAGFLANGANCVVMLDYNGDKVAETASELDPEGARTLPVSCDVSDQAAVHETFSMLYEKLGHIDVLVNNAGINRDRMFHKMTIEQMREVLNVNFFGVVHCCMEVITQMRDQEFGRIINISSTAQHGNVGQTNYAASKGAINGFTRSLAKESTRKGITVNAVEPGYIDTDMLRTIPEDKLAARLAALPPQRFGRPEELAATVLFLASDEASWVNGSILIASGASITV